MGPPAHLHSQASPCRTDLGSITITTFSPTCPTLSYGLLLNATRERVPRISPPAMAAQ